MTSEQRTALATLCKLAIVEQIAKPPSKRDPEYKAIVDQFGLDGLDNLINQLTQ